jgi:hypothetical protein
MIDCRVWNGSNNDDFVYPELDEGVDPYLAGKQNFGIALSGGGMRSVTLSLGWLRGLHEVRNFGISNCSLYSSLSQRIETTT